MLDPINFYKKYKKLKNSLPSLKTIHLLYIASIVTFISGLNSIIGSWQYGIKLMLIALIISPLTLHYLNKLLAQKLKKLKLKIRPSHFLILFVFLLFAVIYSTPQNTSFQHNTKTETTIPTIKSFEQYTVAYLERVIDGDTIEVKIDNKIYKVRYIGVDTPEFTKQPELAQQATDLNKKLLKNKIFLVKDVSETDKYNRLLRYVFTDEYFVNAELVKRGWAKTLTIPPNVRYSTLFNKLEQQARNQHLGIWNK